MLTKWLKITLQSLKNEYTYRCGNQKWLQERSKMENLKLKPEAIRSQLGLTQREFCKMLGIDIQQYQRRIKGITQWRVDELAKMAREVGISMDNIDFN